MKNRIATLLAALLLAVLSPIAFADESSHYVQPHINHPDYGDINIVMPISLGDEGSWMSRMQHANNAVATAKEWNGRAHVVIVVYGAAIKMLTHKGDDIGNTVTKLRDAGVVFKACNNSLKGMGLDWHALNNVAEDDIVPAGILEVPFLERTGYFMDSE